MNEIIRIKYLMLKLSGLNNENIPKMLVNLLVNLFFRINLSLITNQLTNLLGIH
jgi:hypothetical protein